MEHNVAVYGSLLSSLSNHCVMEMAQGKFVQKGIVKGFDMFPIAGLSYPCIAEGAGEVTVEVYTVDDEGLRELDNLEGYPVHYDRQTILVNDKLPAFIYFYAVPPNMEKVPNGNWKKYLSDHWR